MNVFELNPDYIGAKESYINTLQDKYADGSLYLSYSSLSNFRKSPKHFLDYKMKVDEDTDSMILGQALHCLVLEPHKFNDSFASAPECDRRTKEGKAIYSQFLEESKGKTVLTNNMYQTAVEMAISVLSNEEAKKLIDGAHTKEKRIDWEAYGFKFLSFLDGDSENYVFDLKMMPDADPKKVQREILSRCLWLQGGMYLKALEEDKDYFIIAVDKKGNVSVHFLMPSLIDYGKSELRRLCEDFEDCLSTNSWLKSYEYRSHNGIYPIDKPQYNI
ncbi:PD-(D/E)XK nuclease-like domain-containing protein [Sphingobacterium sp. UT-1RO-CII-1]|uniref:PD-(D/E)XK nuclease-like domain-containing protein n=1 Tax=Sphingobacterium sp. UT-1RO-CII-1 TaxID=2995225 RepID=UPI00227B99B9|nr:PD-(D/E)XK nuclease-like domain-containing protein [Sphingobacterium sp. UT-1RO-CII-1]MCY4781462.1 PD-(D/E)XK nuclease-like domain-containing protein [Sphingobacterium sp. UT-1RO-CII-1]